MRLGRDVNSAAAIGLGLRVKSGWARAIMLAGPLEAPRVLDRRSVDLSDAAFPETRQPFHARTGQEETNAERIARRVEAVEHVARKSIGEMIETYRRMGREPRRAILVVGSVIDPGSIGNAHIRAHALEGRLFRTVLADALDSHGLRCGFLVERNAYGEGATALRRSESELKRCVTLLGQDAGRPWGADEKLAALAAWMALCGRVHN